MIHKTITWFTSHYHPQGPKPCPAGKYLLPKATHYFQQSYLKTNSLRNETFTFNAWKKVSLMKCKESASPQVKLFEKENGGKI